MNRNRSLRSQHWCVQYHRWRNEHPFGLWAAWQRIMNRKMAIFMRNMRISLKMVHWTTYAMRKGEPITDEVIECWLYACSARNEILSKTNVSRWWNSIEIEWKNHWKILTLYHLVRIWYDNLRCVNNVLRPNPSKKGSSPCHISHVLGCKDP